MNIQILDSWLREHIDTNANARELASSLSLCGPSFDKVEKLQTKEGVDYLYDIEVTTNRVDMMSVYGIAREASVILPEFGFQAKLKPLKHKKKIVETSLGLNLKIDYKLTNRVMGVVFELDGIGKSPDWMIRRLESSGMRSLNLPVDITNYVMLEIGHPTHVFDYDLIKPNMILRSAKKGESIVSLENKRYELENGDIVIDNGKGEIIDLPGIIGTRNSIVNKETKRILFFMETNDPGRIRKTSMRLGIRTNAAVLNEKGVDPFLAEEAMYRGIELFCDLAKAKIKSEIIDIFPIKPKVNMIHVSHEFIEKILGIEIESKQVLRILKRLGFDIKVTQKSYVISPPTFRSKDIEIPEDIVEEIARIYGYHKLPSVLMQGVIPSPIDESPFSFENEIRNLLRGMGANETYTNSLVSNSMIGDHALAITNPIGPDTSHLRTSLKSSLVEAADINKNEDSFHLFELANVYLPQAKLPDEIMTLAGVIKGKNYRSAKGVIEALLSKLRVEVNFSQKDSRHFAPNHRIQVGDIGEFGVLTNGYFYYELQVEKMKANQKPMRYSSIPKFPPQIEDVTIKLKKGMHISDITGALVNTDKRVEKIEYIGNYKDNHTIRIYYQDQEKTLDDKEVNSLRNKLLEKLVSMGIVPKS